MKYMKTIAGLSIALIATLSSCKRSIPCSNQFITPAFVGFNVTDLDTLVVKEYLKEGNFLHLVDTALIITDPAILRNATAGDTTFVVLNPVIGREKYIFPDHDWRIYLPARNFTVSISGIESPQTESPCFKCGCSNPVNSFIQNTVTVIPQRKRVAAYSGQEYLVTYIRP